MDFVEEEEMVESNNLTGEGVVLDITEDWVLVGKCFAGDTTVTEDGIETDDGVLCLGDGSKVVWIGVERDDFNGVTASLLDTLDLFNVNLLDLIAVFEPTGEDSVVGGGCCNRVSGLSAFLGVDESKLAVTAFNLLSSDEGWFGLTISLPSLLSETLILLDVGVIGVPVKGVLFWSGDADFTIDVNGASFGDALLPGDEMPILGDCEEWLSNSFFFSTLSALTLSLCMTFKPSCTNLMDGCKDPGG
jgi:hypothetical protein